MFKLKYTLLLKWPQNGMRNEIEMLLPRSGMIDVPEHVAGISFNRSALDHRVGGY